MNEWQKKNLHKEDREIDIFRLLQILWKRIWLIVLVTVLCGAILCLYSLCFITPTYRSFFTAYVNNRNDSIEGNGSITTSELNASVALTYLYQDIIVSRSVLMDAAELCGMDEKYETIKSKVSTVLDSESALIGVYVVDTDPVRATQLASAIAQVAPGHVERIRDGSSMRILDAPVQPESKYGPDNMKYILAGAVIGFVLSVIFIVTMDIINDKVRSAEELESRHNIVVIGVIPDLSATDVAGSYAYQNTARGEKK